MLSLGCSPHGNVYGLSKDPVPLLAVCYHLGVPPTNVQHSGVLCPCNQASHFNVTNAMIHTNNRFVPQLSNSSSNYSHTGQGSSHPWTFGICHTIYLVWTKVGL